MGAIWRDDKRRLTRRTDNGKTDNRKERLQAEPLEQAPGVTAGAYRVCLPQGRWLPRKEGCRSHYSSQRPTVIARARGNLSRLTVRVMERKVPRGCGRQVERFGFRAEPLGEREEEVEGH